MIGQLSIPFVIVVGHLALSQYLLRRFRLHPGFGAIDMIGFSVAFGIVPGVEKLASVTPSWRAISLTLLHSFHGCGILIIVLGSLLRNIDLLYRIIRRNYRLEQRIDAAGGHQSISHFSVRFM